MINKLTLMLLCSPGLLAMTLEKLDGPLTIKLSNGFVVSGSEDHTVRIWDAEGNLLAVCVGHDSSGYRSLCSAKWYNRYGF